MKIAISKFTTKPTKDIQKKRNGLRTTLALQSVSSPFGIRYNFNLSASIRASVVYKELQRLSVGILNHIPEIIRLKGNR